MDKILEINNIIRAKIDKKYLEKVAQTTLKTCNFKDSIKISLVFAEEKLSQKLNYQYRGKNQSTDVLSFRYNKNEGEIIICYSIAKKQARENKISIKNELTRLLVHGILHLVGYDHKTNKDKLAMEALEKKILEYI